MAGRWGIYVSSCVTVPNRTFPRHGTIVASDGFRCALEPIADPVGVCKEVADGFESAVGEIAAGFEEKFVVVEGVEVFELALDLSAGADKHDAIHGGHDGLLHDFALKVGIDQTSDLLVFGTRFTSDFPFDQLENRRVDIAWLGTVCKIDLPSSTGIPTDGCVVLEAIARSVHVDRK
jgi:hypothetical protein